MKTETTIYAWLLERTRGVRAMWSASVGARFLNQLALVAVLVLAAEAFTGAPLGPTLVIMAIVSVGKALLRYLEHFAGHWVAFTMLARLRTEFYQTLIPLSPSIVKGNDGAELSERATRDIDRLEVFYAHTVPPALCALAVPLVTVTWVAARGEVLAAALMLGAAAFMIGIPVVTGHLARRDSQILAAQNGRVAEVLGDTIQGLATVSIFNAGPERLTLWRTEEGRAARTRAALRNRATWRTALVTIVQLSTLIILVPIAPMPIVAAWVGLWVPLRGVDDFADGLDEAMASAERVRTIMDQSSPVQSPAHTSAGAQPRLSMQARGVTFRYSPAQLVPVLNDVNLDLRPGSWSYLVGVSGCGKSTLARLLVRGWDPDCGRITFQGLDLREYCLTDLRKQVQLVPQRPWLLADTLGANLRLVNPQASQAELWQALEAVDLKDWASELPRGLEEEITMDGSNLSGGQIQRLAVARSLLARPALLILDEATSQLDSATALKVRANLARAGMTVLEITHQLSQIPPTAPVSVLDGGGVVECGNAADLAADPDSCFTRLSQRQTVK